MVLLYLRHAFAVGTRGWRCLAGWCSEHEPCKRVSVQSSVVRLGGRGGGKTRRGEKLQCAMHIQLRGAVTRQRTEVEFGGLMAVTGNR